MIYKDIEIEVSENDGQKIYQVTSYNIGVYTSLETIKRLIDRHTNNDYQKIVNAKQIALNNIYKKYAINNTNNSK